ncbi:hypothetical protein [Thalassotalea sp. ND16A]|uniref:hypothetical protein n=1 Tax=Thalassotalea sp. ND16A TaxID=1535422 RepID=UPI00051A2D92|nr:hypothetical protein [Thalassotalea sp. ND16A]KGJ92078.1 hypothetical protein ND16A_1772 [Thalassotalea sp. ND16A]
MKNFQHYIDLGTSFLFIGASSDMAKVGMDRTILVLYWVGRFGFSSKIVFEYLMGLSREAVNKLMLRLVKQGYLTEKKSFGSKDGAVYYLTAKGKRYAEFETNLSINQSTDTSGHNSKNEIHDLSIQVCIIDRLRCGSYNAFVTEKELREYGYGTFGANRKERAVDGLLFNGKEFHAVEVEASNSKNLKSGKSDVRADILKKYSHQLNAVDGLYTRVLLFSHRERFLRQIDKKISILLESNEQNYSGEQIFTLKDEIKYVNSFCSTLFNLFWDPEYKHSDSHLVKVDKQEFQLMLQQHQDAPSASPDYIDGFRSAGELLKLL